MQQIALVANHRNAWPDRAEIDALGVKGLRSIVYDNDEFERALEQVPPGVRVVAMLNNEHRDVGFRFENWSAAVQEFARRFEGRVHAVECANELDLWGESPDLGARLVRMARGHLEHHGMLTLMSSVAGGDWTGWLSDACQLSLGWYDGVCLHPYGQRPDGFRDESWMFGWLRDAVNAAHQIAQAPVYLTEWGVKIADAGGEDGQDEYLVKGVETIRSLGPSVVPFAAYFAWHDGVGAPHEQGTNAFGLRAHDGRQRPAWYGFQDAMSVVNDGGDPSLPEARPDMDAVTSAYADLWQAVNSKLEYNETIATFGLPTHWRAHLDEMGSPVGPEHAEDDGSVVQAFTRGVFRWHAADGTVEKVS
jgi:hypothetical protein